MMVEFHLTALVLVPHNVCAGSVMLELELEQSQTQTKTY